MKKIVIFESQIDSLRRFAILMSEGFRKIGYQVLLTDMKNTRDTAKRVYEFAEYGNTAALFFNQTGLNLLSEKGTSIWNDLDVDCYNYIVDHPMYYHAAIIFPVRHLTFLCVDKYHQQYIERFYPGQVRSFFLPLAGIRGAKETVPFEERSMDILFTGEYMIDNNIELHLHGFDKGVRQLWLACYELLCKKTYLTLEQGLEYCLREKGLELPEEDLRDTIRLFQDMDGMLRSRMRAEVVRTLANAGIKVHVYGGGWHFLNCKQENLIIHDRIPFDETIPLIADARITLNVMPWFKYGAHDRIYSAMLNEGVSLTDSSEYLNQGLTDGREVLFYSLEHLEELPEKVEYYLQHPAELKEIAHRGNLYAKDTQTWQYRARQVAEIIEESF